MSLITENVTDLSHSYPKVVIYLLLGSIISSMNSPPSHAIPNTDLTPSYYKNFAGIRYQKSYILFSDASHPIFSIRAGNTLEFSSQKMIIEASDLLVSSEEKITLEFAGAVEISAQSLTLSTKKSSISIHQDGIHLKAKKIILSTPDVQKRTLVACVGDQHQCPQSNGTSPHVGGIIEEGSKNVFIQGIPIARHGDYANCLGAPNQIISLLKRITVNGKAIAYQQCPTLHQGYIITAASHVFLEPHTTL